MGVTCPPVQCSNTGLKKRNKKCEIFIQPSNAPYCCSSHSDLKGLLGGEKGLHKTPNVWKGASYVNEEEGSNWMKFNNCTIVEFPNSIRRVYSGGITAIKQSFSVEKQ